MKSFHSQAFCKSLNFLMTLLLCFVWTMAAPAQNTINTIAGGGSVNGPAKGPLADIAGPSSVAQDSKGNTYIAAPAQNQVFKVDASGNLTVFAGTGYPTEDPQKLDGGPATLGTLNNPVGVWADAKGDVVIADTTDYLIRGVTYNAAKGTNVISNLAGNAHQCQNPTAAPPACGDTGAPYNATLGAPTAAVADKSGNIYIADTNDNRIRVVNRTSATITIAGVQIAKNTINTIAGTGYTCTSPTSACGDGGPALSATMNGPNGIALDSNGNIYFADTGDRKIRMISNSTGIITTYAGTGNSCAPAQGCGNGGAATAANISAPWQISFDSSNNLYITEPPVNDIREVTYSTRFIQTVAGNNTRGYGGDGGPATAATVNGPRGVWASPGGGFIIGDTGDQVVRSVLSGTITTLAGGNGTTVASGGDGGPATSAILAGNRATAVDSFGNVYIADTANNRIRKISGCSGTAGTGFCTSNITTFAGTGIANYSGDGGPATSATLNGPEGVGVDASGNVYIADSNNLVVRMVDVSSGIITTVAGNGKACAPSCGDGGQATKASFAFPTTVEVDTSGNIYIADQRGNQIRIVYPGGIIGTFAGTGAPATQCSMGAGGPATAAQLNGPFSVAPDLFGNVYIADTNDNQVMVVNSAGIIEPYAFDCNGKLFGPEKVAALKAAYQTPQDLAIDPNGNMYVAGSALYYVIQRVDYNDINPLNMVIGVSGKVGDPKYYGFTGDGGPALGAELDNYGASIDASGHLYVADGVNNRVREILLTPTSSISPSSLVFQQEPIGTTSPAQTFKIINGGSDDLYISSFTVTGDFALTNPAPCLNNQVAPQSNCIVSVTFTPTTYGTRTGKIVINDNAYQDPSQTVYLTGYGPDFSISASPNSLTVTRGNQGMSTLTLTPGGGFNQTINLTCSGKPANSTCTISPSSVTLDGVNAATATLTIATTSSTPTGSYTLNAKGTSVTTHTAQIALTVQ
jgi:hypothetical protein